MEFGSIKQVSPALEGSIPPVQCHQNDCIQLLKALLPSSGKTLLNHQKKIRAFQARIPFIHQEELLHLRKSTNALLRLLRM